MLNRHVFDKIFTEFHRILRIYLNFTDPRPCKKSEALQRENHVKLTQKFTQKSCSTTHRNSHFLPSNPIQSKKLSQKLFPPKWSLPGKCLAKEKMGQEKKQGRRGDKALFLRILKLRFCKLIVCYCRNRRPQSAQRAKGFLVGFSSQ